MRWSVLLGAFVFLLTLTACGGGGGGGGGVGASPDPSPGQPPEPDPRPIGSASVAGEIEIPAGSGATIQDREPNDSVDQAQGLGALDGLVAVTGHLDASDSVDGFRLYVEERVEVSALLAFEPGASFDLFVYDVNALRVVAQFDQGGNRVAGAFLARGVFDLVVRRVAGSGRYVLRVESEAITGAVAEVEPNDTVASAHYGGGVVAGDQITFSGVADAGGDDTDLFVVSTEAPTSFDIAVAFPATADYDLYVYDVTDGADAAVELGSSYSATDNPETLTVTAPANRLVLIQMHAWSGSGAYQLDVGVSAGAGSSSVAYELESVRPASLEAGVYELGSTYGDPVHEMRRGEVIVVPEDGQDLDALKAELADAGLVWAAGGEDGPQLFRTPVASTLDATDAARLTVSRAAALVRRKGVKIAEPNGVMYALTVPNDPAYPQQWHYEMVRLPQAWEMTTGDSNVRVAIVDTGSTPHPDMAGRWVDGYDFVGDEINSEDGDGYDPDPTDPGDAYLSWHGTHVAATVGAGTDNGSGVAGVTWQTEIMPVRVLGYLGGSSYDVLQGVLYAAGLPNAANVFPSRRADVINMSLGGGAYSDSFQDAVDRARAAGVVVVAAAGNDGTSDLHYPAAYDGVIAVSAVGPDRSLASYSTYGNWLDVAAPGGDQINSESEGVLSASWSGGSPSYAWYQGTSMATPHVAGIVALMRAVAPDLTPAELESLLESSAQDIGSAGFDSYYGHGLVDAEAAVALALSRSNADPELDVSGVLDLSWMRTEAALEIRNAGGAHLDVDPPDVVSGASWIQAWLDGASDARRSHERLVVRITPSALDAQGVYEGRVRLTSNGGTRDVIVLAEVLDLTSPIDAEVFVVFVDEASGETVVSQRLTGGERAFDVSEVPAGSYLVVAGTDVDGDGWIGGDGELFGWMDGSPGARLVLQSDERRTGVRVEVRPESAGTARRFAR